MIHPATAAQSASPTPLDTSRFHSADRLVVASTAGVFQPGDLAAGSAVHEGQVIGHVRTGVDQVAVTSPFAGTVRAALAWPEERVHRYQPLLWVA